MPSNREVKKPIGVFDSGVGGLTIVREIRKLLPSEDLFYYGDMARLPYGIKSQNQIIRFSIANTQFLKKKNVKAIVVACNSSASAALKSLRLQFSSFPFIDVINPVALEASRLTKGNVGVIATQATIESNAYQKAIHAIDKQIKVTQKACPLFVSFVEEGLCRGKIIRGVAEHYLDSLKKKKIDTLILGCTHYPLLKSVIQSVMGKSVKVIDSTTPTVQALKNTLIEKDMKRNSTKKGSLRIFVTDKPRNFKKVAEKFLGEKISEIKLVRN